jgi:hypothetical protein
LRQNQLEQLMQLKQQQRLLNDALTFSYLSKS